MTAGRRSIDTGHPAVTVPAGLLDGLPVGLQAVAAPHRDDVAVLLAWLAAVSRPDPPVRWTVPRG
jgi:amidase